MQSSQAVRGSICVFCGSSFGNEPIWAETAKALGTALAKAQLRLVYGGGGVGLMGETARAAHAASAPVLGIMPAFLRDKERLLDEVETIVVETMHERKALMYEESDAFVVAPGGIGTLEEAIELMSWRRLSLHKKPIYFLNVREFWSPLMAVLRGNIEAGFTPDWFESTLQVVPDVDTLMQAIEADLA